MTATHVPAPGLGTRIVQACDADGDGHQDLLPVDYAANLRLYLGNGDGAFHDATATSFTPSTPTARTLIIGDADNDGAPDPAVRANGLYANDGAGPFTLTLDL